MSKQSAEAKNLLEKFLEWFKKLFKLKKQSARFPGGQEDSSTSDLPEEDSPKEKYIDRILSEKDKNFLSDIQTDINKKIEAAIENDNFAEQYQWEAMKFAIENFFDAEGRVNKDFDIDKYLNDKSQVLHEHIEAKYGSEDVQAEIAYNESLPARKEAMESFYFKADFSKLLKKHEPETIDNKDLYHDANDVSLRVGLSHLASLVDVSSRDSYLRNSPEWVQDERASESAKSQNEEIKDFVNKAHDQNFYEKRGGRASSIKSAYDDAFSI